MAAVIENEIAVPGMEALVQRAKDMIPWLREQAESVEQTRSVPKSTVEAFRKAGFFKILQPKRWGGYAMSPEVLYRVVTELSRGCPSSGWTVAILAIHQWEFGKLNPKAGDEVWANDQDILVSSSYAPTGKARRVEGGWMLSGRWPTSSGSEHADWGAFLGARIYSDKGELVDMNSFLVKHEDYELVDDWHVIGLCGTGSKSLVIKNEAFVPDHRTHSFTRYELNDSEWTYQMPFNQVFNGVIAAAIIGIAQGVVDLFIEHTKPKQNQFAMGPGPVKSPFVQEKLGNAVVLIRSARARLLQDTQEVSAFAQRRELVPLELRVQHLLDVQFTAKDCFAAGQMVFKKSGARGIFLNVPLLRQFRSLVAASNHITQNEDDISALVGAYLLGEPIPPGIFEPPVLAGA
ncbi:acyl-CoA dehydrogenase family protein [Paraburkholderia lycopersici]|uniref:3-hydroxy-9,10-secoandrosta-1,3,5(10)-triene-9,17-dione monooxygenase n=1 Tax=Paraburkholderia lycopersici TaxID=416944 RepID=A0A1G7CHZ2_9BURK|nr:acyl-CoA dehydrogenase family protein [Paraburkholderia lycopersici]SDE38978.1 3-hydroxy-9,10-secoandrosta-1,3,5(10)-triene-9,17-dione monooxygenase [Paraburkholderia lycopersici]